ncbi:MAG: hypothetical protein WC325_10345 [Candidatus Bathyarchaeia archaeon]
MKFPRLFSSKCKYHNKPLDCKLYRKSSHECNNNNGYNCGHRKTVDHQRNNNA